MGPREKRLNAPKENQDSGRKKVWWEERAEREKGVCTRVDLTLSETITDR